MKALASITFLITLIVFAGSPESQVKCHYSTGVEITIEKKNMRKSPYTELQASPEKLYTRKIFIQDVSKFSKVDDYIEIKMGEKSVTYPLFCEKA